jgi:hypothetical protein
VSALGHELMACYEMSLVHLKVDSNAYGGKVLHNKRCTNFIIAEYDEILFCVK